MMKWRMKNWIQTLRLISPSHSHDLPSSPDYSSLLKHPLQRPSRCLKRKRRQLMSKMPRMLPRQRSPQYLSKPLSRPRKREPEPQRLRNMHPHLRQKPDEPLGLPTSWPQPQHPQSALARRVPSTHGFEPRSPQADQARNALLANHWPQLLPRERAPRCHTAGSSLLQFVSSFSLFTIPIIASGSFLLFSI